MQVENLVTSSNLLEQYKKAVDCSNIVTKTDVSGTITYVNDAFIRISGYDKDELLGKTHSVVRHPDMKKKVFKQMWQTISDKQVWKGIVKNRKKDGSAYYVDATIIPILDDEGAIVEYIGIRKDITKLIRQNKLIRAQNIDALTKLPNRNKLIDVLHKNIFRNVILINLDLFREINDFYGLEIGDGVLKGIAGRLMEVSHELAFSFRVYKLPADEYALFSSEQITQDELEKIAYKVYHEISKEALEVRGVEIYVSSSIGIYCGRGDLAINKAKMALKHAKESKRIIGVYGQSIKQQHSNNLKWVRILKHAIAQNRIIAYYQPIINNQTGKVEKYEGLVRLIDEEGEVISPINFLGVAKKSRLYPYITKAIVTHVLSIANEFLYDFSVNISVEDITDANTRNMIVEALKENKEHAGRIVFEITESENIENFKEVKEFIKEMKAYGCKIAIDDFGSGYSNFEYLANLDLDYIKLDGSLIKNIDVDKNLQIIVKTIVDFAKQLGIKTVAEFIHSKDVYDVSKKLGIDYSQGYYFSEPKELDSID